MSKRNGKTTASIVFVADKLESFIIYTVGTEYLYCKHLVSDFSFIFYGAFFSMVKVLKQCTFICSCLSCMLRTQYTFVRLWHKALLTHVYMYTRNLCNSAVFAHGTKCIEK